MAPITWLDDGNVGAGCWRMSSNMQYVSGPWLLTRWRCAEWEQSTNPHLRTYIVCKCITRRLILPWWYGSRVLTFIFELIVCKCMIPKTTEVLTVVCWHTSSRDLKGTEIVEETIALSRCMKFPQGFKLGRLRAGPAVLFRMVTGVGQGGRDGEGRGRNIERRN